MMMSFMDAMITYLPTKTRMPFESQHSFCVLLERYDTHN